MDTSTETNTRVPDFEAAAERARGGNEQLAEVGRKVTTAYLDGVEKYVAGVAQFERKFGTQTQVDSVASLLRAHADLTEEITKVSVSAARELITA
jgi:mono/diheme cytochrome c family protein